MKFRVFSLRLLLAVGLVTAAVGVHGSTGAQAARLSAARLTMQLNRNTFVGIVANVQGLPTDPSMFALVLGSTTTTVRTDEHTMIVGVALESQVEGVVDGDYAVVWTHRVKGDLVATRIRYDVAPIPPLHQVIGTVVRANPQFNRIFLRSAPDRVVTIRVSINATFTLGGLPTTVAPTIVKGDVLQIVCLQRDGLVAFQIDVKSAPGGQLRSQSI